MKLLCLSILSFWTASLFGQSQIDPDLERYYPANELFKKNKVKTCFFTNALFPIMNSITEYDTLGREIYSICAGIRNYTSYLENKDTLVSMTYRESDSIQKYLHTVEKHVFNNDGSIAFYLICHKWPTHQVRSRYEKFIYNPCDQSVSIYHYRWSNYSFASFSANIPFVEAFYKLTDIELVEQGEDLDQNNVIEKNAAGLVIKEYFIFENKRSLNGTYEYKFYQ